MNDWVFRNSRRFIVIFACVVAVLTGATVYLLILEVDDRRKLGTVDLVGPCRTEGINHPECKRQTRLIFRACVRHGLHPACELAGKALERRRDSSGPGLSQGWDRPSESGRGGGQSSSGSPGSQPTPSPGGGGGSGGGGGNGSGGPPTPTPAPNPPSTPAPKPLRPALDNLTDTVQGAVDSTCETVGNLGVPAC